MIDLLFPIYKVEMFGREVANRMEETALRARDGMLDVLYVALPTYAEINCKALADAFSALFIIGDPKLDLHTRTGSWLSCHNMMYDLDSFVEWSLQASEQGFSSTSIKRSPPVDGMRRYVRLTAS